MKSQLLRLQLKVDLEQMPTLVEPAEQPLYRHLGTDEMNQRLMDVAEQMPPQLFLLLTQTVAYAVDVLEEASQKGDRHRRRQPASEAAGVPGRRQGPPADELSGRQQGEPARAGGGAP